MKCLSCGKETSAIYELWEEGKFSICTKCMRRKTTSIHKLTGIDFNEYSHPLDRYNNI